MLSDYVHFAHSTIAERAGRASLAETLIAPLMMRPALKAVAGLASRPPVRGYEPPVKPAPSLHPDALVEMVRADPDLRERLLVALLENTRPA